MRQVFATAGRKLVALDGFFSNPYVDLQVRRADRDAMFDLLASGESAQFLALASRYRVRYIVVSGTLQKAALLEPAVFAVWRHQELTIYGVGSTELKVPRRSASVAAQ